ncbi:response regulator [Streptomyces sp. AN091965]|uniref:response regulator n=1 Tax=Streptomyces sp. AN091965 TaxID=2927803 RepID=UPI001F612EE5|nr:response regulator [Streptomyces sp. AN091965]MCI3934887.1 response regulator [Streptomyces sp. AN091965]
MPSHSKVLVVDDHEDYLFALESALAPLGYETTCATNGDDALKEILRGHIAVALLDVRMPGVDGLDVVRYVRGVEQTQLLPIILLTGFDVSQELSATALRLGVADIVVKPVDPWTLRTKVRYLYDTYQRLRALQAELDGYRSRSLDGVRPAAGGPARRGVPKTPSDSSAPPDAVQVRVPSQPKGPARRRPLPKD